MLDWRANRLVDALAKTVAAHVAAPNEVIKFLQKADAAGAHAACLMGVVTHAANNHTSSAAGEDGRIVHTVFRDSNDRQWGGAVPASTRPIVPMPVAPAVRLRPLLLPRLCCLGRRPQPR